MKMEPKPRAEKFYLDSIDEVFAEIFSLFGGAFHVRMEIFPETSFIRAFFSPRAMPVSSEKTVDFELSTCGCRGTGASDLGEYLGTRLHTSSALEFFDYAFSQRSGVACDVDFAGNSWIITVDD